MVVTRNFGDRTKLIYDLLVLGFQFSFWLQELCISKRLKFVIIANVATFDYRMAVSKLVLLFAL
jgi:hypothetical protein